jgi:crossover junction endodeoxyribonuclease RuvC
MKPAAKVEKVILGIDPGTNIMGYGMIHCSGQTMKLMQCGVIKLDDLDDHMLKLQKITERCNYLITQFNPDEVAIEAPFYGKNVQSMLKLGRAQGAAIAAALWHNLPVYEYAPKKIKMSITGNGNASKEQVSVMLQQLLKFEELPKYLDATDGLAAAVCHHFQNGRTSVGTGKNSWKSFISKNPGRML